MVEKIHRKVLEKFLGTGSEKKLRKHSVGKRSKDRR